MANKHSLNTSANSLFDRAFKKIDEKRESLAKEKILSSIEQAYDELGIDDMYLSRVKEEELAKQAVISTIGDIAIEMGIDALTPEFEAQEAMKSTLDAINSELSIPEKTIGKSLSELSENNDKRRLLMKQISKKNIDSANDYDELSYS